MGPSLFGFRGLTREPLVISDGEKEKKIDCSFQNFKTKSRFWLLDPMWQLSCATLRDVQLVKFKLTVISFHGPFNYFWNNVKTAVHHLSLWEIWTLFSITVLPYRFPMPGSHWCGFARFRWVPELLGNTVKVWTGRPGYHGQFYYMSSIISPLFHTRHIEHHLPFERRETCLWFPQRVQKHRNLHNKTFVFFFFFLTHGSLCLQTKTTTKCTSIARHFPCDGRWFLRGRLLISTCST